VSNPLKEYCATEDISETALMNLLQRCGICSDNCVWAEDVGNAGECVGWLRGLERFDTTSGESV
jgi:hypothetical protein